MAENVPFNYVVIGNKWPKRYVLTMSSLVTIPTDDLGEKLSPKEEFKRYANTLREVTAMRLKATGRGGAGGGVQWWARLPDSFRVFLLSTVAPDDWERYDGAQWEALPEGLRSAIAAECRAVHRVAGGCPWR